MIQQFYESLNLLILRRSSRIGAGECCWLRIQRLSQQKDS